MYTENFVTLKAFNVFSVFMYFPFPFNFPNIVTVVVVVLMVGVVATMMMSFFYECLRYSVNENAVLCFLQKEIAFLFLLETQ